MHYLDYHEKIQHLTGDYPLAHYPVDENFPRYRMTTHWHKESELVFVRSGRLRLYLDDLEFLLEAGDLMSIGGGVIHGGEPENCVYECIVFDPQAVVPALESCRVALKPFLRNNVFLKSSLIESEPELKFTANRLFSLASNPLGRELALAGAEFDFLSCELENLDKAQLHTVSERTWQKAEQLKPALEYIEQHYGQHISLEMLARKTGFSPKYFCHYFRTIVHRSPIDYLNYYRIECASHFLISADLNVAEVAMHCGFSDSSAFIKQFRKYKGTTPKQYKLKVQEGASRVS